MLSRGVPSTLPCPVRSPAPTPWTRRTRRVPPGRGLAVDKGLTIAHLRARPGPLLRYSAPGEPPASSYFLTEPSAEMDLVPPEEGGRLDRERLQQSIKFARQRYGPVYSGFAFGMGIERTLMPASASLTCTTSVEERSFLPAVRHQWKGN